MLIHEFNLLSDLSLDIGWDEIVDSTSTPGYTFYGLAKFTAAGTPPSTASAIWYIFALNTATVKTRYYPANQIWNNRATLTLP